MVAEVQSQQDQPLRRQQSDHQREQEHTDALCKQLWDMFRQQTDAKQMQAMLQKDPAYMNASPQEQADISNFVIVMDRQASPTTRI